MTRDTEAKAIIRDKMRECFDKMFFMYQKVCPKEKITEFREFLDTKDFGHTLLTKLDAPAEEQEKFIKKLRAGL